MPAMFGGHTLKLTEGPGFSQYKAKRYGYLPHDFSTLDQLIYSSLLTIYGRKK